MLDIPGGHGKSPIGPNYLIILSPGEAYRIDDYLGRSHSQSAARAAGSDSRGSNCAFALGRGTGHPGEALMKQLACLIGLFALFTVSARMHKGIRQTGAGPTTGPRPRRVARARTDCSPEGAGQSPRSSARPAAGQRPGLAACRLASSAAARGSPGRPSPRQAQRFPEANRSKPRTP